MIVFYSWQLDLPAVSHKNFIRNCLQDAIGKLNEHAEFSEAERQSEYISEKIELDHDTQGILGTPDIAATILRKIDKCDVFVADVSFTGTGLHNDKVYPNSNVLFELGYVMGKFSDEKTILVMDSATGKPEQLPFDLRHKRRPRFFDSKAADMTKERARFSQDLAGILSAYFLAHHSKASDTVDLQLRLTYRKEDIQQDWGVPAIRQRQFKLDFFAKNNGLNTLRRYEVQVAVPREIVQTSCQTGKRTDEQSECNAMFQFPISQDNPLPDLAPGRELSIAQVLCIVSERHAEHRSVVLNGKISATLYADGMQAVSRSYPVKDIDPFRLMDITNDSCQPNRVYELKFNQ